MGDIGKRTAMDKRGVVLERLYQVRLDCVFQKCSHCTLSVDIVDRDRLSVEGIGDHHAAQACLQIHQIGGEAECCHHFRGDSDIEAVLTRLAVGGAAQTVDDISELAVVHIDTALPDDPTRVDIELIALLDVVVEHRSTQVVCSPDCMKVPGEMQVDVFHRHDLCIAATRGATFDTEDWAQGGLTQTQECVFAELTQRIFQTD